MESTSLYAFLDSLASHFEGGRPLTASQKCTLVSLWSETRDACDGGLQQLIKDLETAPERDELMECDENYHARIDRATADFKTFHAHPMTSSLPGGWVYPVFFCTNRTRTDKGFSAARSSECTLGKCDVFIPRKRLYGDLGRSLLNRLLHLEIKRDDVTVQNTITTPKERFWRSLNSETAKGEPGARHALLYIHGFRCTFEDAVVRAAQLGFDLNINGATSVFSWPSQGNLFGYLADAAAAEASENALSKYLTDFIRKSKAEVIHIIAHSMGNRPLMRALCGLARDQPEVPPFGQIVFAAPDVDRDFFLQRASQLSRICKRGTVYASADDRAVRVSAWLQGGRVGYVPPVTATPELPTLNTIVVPGVGIDLIGHTYFGEATGILSDILLMFIENRPPATRPRLIDRGGYWEMIAGRPGA